MKPNGRVKRARLRVRQRGLRARARRLCSARQTGADGSPGNRVYQSDTQYVHNVPVLPNFQFFSFSNLNIPPLMAGGAYYIGIRWNPSQDGYFKYSANDVDGPYRTGYYWSNFQPYWTPIEQEFPYGYRCLGYRTEGTSLIGISGNENDIPEEYSLFQNYPNPFNSKSIFRYQIPKMGFAALKVYDVLWNEVENLVNEELNAGTYEIQWDATNYPSGVVLLPAEGRRFCRNKEDDFNSVS